MTTAFEPLGPIYRLALADDSSLFSLTIGDTNSIGATWQVSNLDSANVIYVHISTAEFDSDAIVPDVGVPGKGTAVLPLQSAYIEVNVTGAATGNVYVSGAVTGTAVMFVAPGRLV
jgi:hypothetical protein